MKNGGWIDFVAEDLEELRRIKASAILHKKHKVPLAYDPAILTEEDQVISNLDCKVINTCKLGKIPRQISFEDARLQQ